MINIRQMLQKVASRRSWTGYRYLRKNMSFGTAEGALSMSWKGRKTAYLGAPINEITGLNLSNKVQWAAGAAIFAGSVGMMAAGMNPLAVLMPAIPIGTAAVAGAKKIGASLAKSAAAREEAEDAAHAAMMAPAPSAEVSFKVEKKTGELFTKHEVQVFKGENKIGRLSGTREAGSSRMLIDEADLAYEFRGQGLGKQMYSRLFESAKESNLTSVVSGGVVSEDAQRVWRSFAKKGAPVVEEMGKAGPSFSIDLSSFVAESHLAPRAAKIEGLAERGMATGIRKILTAFGSGFQGMKPQMASPARFLKLVGASEESIRATDIQHGRYQAGELNELVQAWKQKKQIEPVEIFVDAYKNIIGAEGRHRALAAMKAGVAEIPIIIRNKQAVQAAAKAATCMMDTGEGAAIARAGTSEIPAVLRATSRIIRNAL